MGTDPDIVQRARAGDRAAFDALHARYDRMVHGILLAGLPAEDAEDATQEVFLLAWRQIGALHDDHAFGSWIAGIARNRRAEVGRRTKRRRLVDSLLQAWDGGCAWMGIGSVTGAQAQSDAARILAAIRELPEAYRETLALRLVEGLGGAEIAELTDMSPGSVRVNLHRGMALLRERLGEGA